MSIRTSFMLAAVLAAASVPALAFADSSGAPGYVTSLTVNTKSSDSAGSYRGSVRVREGAEPGSPNREYRWGGTICSGRDLAEIDIALLTEALRGRSDTQIVPRYKMGQAGARCLVSFTLQEPVFTEAKPQ
jgi:hypothetical protein